jgi:acetyltransferase-like isoleucine patch superfamily enzyme
MTDEELDKLAKELAPFMAEQLLGTIAIAGTSLRLKIGNNVYPTNTIFNTSSGIITIEDDVFFGHNVCVLPGTHDMTKKGMARINSFPKKGRDIIIRRGAWISSNVTILGPCEIGENSVIGACSLVTENVPENCLYAGTSAKFIKHIEFTD